MPYDPMMIKPMRDEMVLMGARELISTTDVDEFLAETKGAALLFFNSVCGCAAGSARPGLALSLQHDPAPDRVGTIFAGQDLEAAARARAAFPQYPPSSPSIVFLNNGEEVGYMHRTDIEGRDPRAVSEALIEAYEQLSGGI